MKSISSKEANSDNQLVINNIWLLAVSLLNVYLFIRTIALATNFTRIYSSAFNQGYSQIVIFAFALNFFFLFRNLSNVALIISGTKEGSRKEIGGLGVLTLFSLLFLLVLSIVPELLLSASYATR